MNADWRAKMIREFIDKHQDKVDWDLAAICKEVGLPLSGRQARRLFKASMGTGIKEYVKKRRLATAAEQLRLTDSAIKTIAVDLGYKHARNLARSFKRVFLLNPMEFRKVCRKTASRHEVPPTPVCHAVHSDTDQVLIQWSNLQ
jgi:transcriptional regulator GlxA family with amidase domain